MTVESVLEELKALGSESVKSVLVKHGAKEPFYGVKIGDLKPIVKRIQKNYPLALELYDTGVSDAMYLAGLVTDDDRMTPDDLQHWADGAYWSLLNESTVPWVAAEGRHGAEMARKWIDSDTTTITTAGWCTWSSLVGIKPDRDLDLREIDALLDRADGTVRAAPNRVRYNMAGFVICVGCYVAPLTERALEIGSRMTGLNVDMGDTSCKVPNVVDYIRKVEARGTIGKKRKTAKC